jgi:hypothetical protein
VCLRVDSLGVNAMHQPPLQAEAAQERTRDAVACTPWLGTDSASKTWEAVAAGVFPQEPAFPACWFYLCGRRYFATASSPICLPMAVPASVELR